MDGWYCGMCNHVFDPCLQKNNHKLQMHPIASLYEEMEQPNSADELITVRC